MSSGQPFDVLGNSGGLGSRSVLSLTKLRCLYSRSDTSRFGLGTFKSRKDQARICSRRLRA